MSYEVKARLWEAERRSHRLADSIERQSRRLAAAWQSGRTAQWRGGQVVGGERDQSSVTISMLYVDGRPIIKHDSGSSWVDGFPARLTYRPNYPDLSGGITTTYYASPLTGQVTASLVNGGWYNYAAGYDGSLFATVSSSGICNGAYFQSPSSGSVVVKQRLHPDYPSTTTPQGWEVWEGSYHFRLGTVKISVGGGANTTMSINADNTVWSATIGGVIYYLGAVGVTSGSYFWWRVGKLRWDDGGPIPPYKNPDSTDYANNTLTWTGTPGGTAIVTIYA